jgi:hypothetical protein
MKVTIELRQNWTFGVVTIVLAALFSLFPVLVQAQGNGGQGQNAVYPSSGTCCTGSQAFIDASMFATSPPPPVDFCKVVNWVLTHGYPAAGAVIDARALNSNNTSMACSASPWAGISSPPPSTILLPATGTNPIVISRSWILPSNTHLIGAGDGVPDTTNSVYPGTTLQVNTSTFTVPGRWPTQA